MFELAEEAFGKIALLIELTIDGALNPSAALGQKVSGSACLVLEFDDGLRVISAISAFAKTFIMV